MDNNIVKDKVRTFCNKYKFTPVINKFRFIKNINSDSFISINVYEFITKINIEYYRFNKYNYTIEIDNLSIINEEYDIIEHMFKIHILKAIEELYKKILFDEGELIINKKIKMKIIEILNIPIYNTTICCFIGGTKEDFELLYEDNINKINKEEYDYIIKDLENDLYAGFVSCINDGSYFLCIKEKYIKNYNIVIHELFHLTNHILWDRDVDLDKKGEAYAYLIGWLSEQYFNIIDNYEREEIEEVEQIIENNGN